MGEQEERIELFSEVEGKNALILTADRLRLNLYVTVRFGSKQTAIGAQRIRQALDQIQLKPTLTQEHKIESFLASHAENPEQVEDHLLITGRPPAASGDAPIFWGPEEPDADEVAEAQAAAVKEEGESGEEDVVDHYSLSSLNTVKPGEVICRFGEPTSGEDGLDIHGRTIPARAAKSLPVKLGENVDFDPETKTVTATVEGVIDQKNEWLSIQPLVEVDGDVDFGVGNIDFDGAVHVKGNILDGFSVKATRDLWVGGNIEGATVEVGGNIKVDGGITGHGKGKITAEGTIEAKYINGATVQACRDILIETEIVNSSTTANGMILINKGGIIGGQTTAGYAIVSMTLGSQMYVPTEIRLSDKMRGRRTQRFTKELIDIRQAEMKIVPVIQKFTQNPELIRKLPPDKQQAISQLAKQLKQLRSRKEELMDSAERYKPKRRIARQVYVKKMVYPKVALDVDTFPMRVHDETRGPVKFRSDKKASRVEVKKGYETGV